MQADSVVSSFLLALAQVATSVVPPSLTQTEVDGPSVLHPVQRPDPYQGSVGWAAIVVGFWSQFLPLWELFCLMASPAHVPLACTVESLCTN